MQHRVAHNSSKVHYLLMAGVQCVVIRTCPFLGTFLALVSRSAEHLHGEVDFQHRSAPVSGSQEKSYIP